VRSGDALAGELLDVLDRALGAEVDELADDGDAFVVGEMNVGLVVEGFSIDVLRWLVRSRKYG
jgi:hypothetical protein